MEHPSGSHVSLIKCYHSGISMWGSTSKQRWQHCACIVLAFTTRGPICVSQKRFLLMMFFQNDSDILWFEFSPFVVSWLCCDEKYCSHMSSCSYKTYRAWCLSTHCASPEVKVHVCKVRVPWTCPLSSTTLGERLQR